MLWGTDNIKTYGESLAQVMMMVGINPVSDALGRVNKLEVGLFPPESFQAARVESKAVDSEQQIPSAWITSINQRRLDVTPTPVRKTEPTTI